MSQIPSSLPSATPTASVATPAATGSNINTLTSSDFIKLMITQLEHQDPLNPTNSNDLLTQMSQISNLQSNQSMVSSLQGLTLQQSIGAGGNLIGKTVMGISDSGTQVSGTVTAVKVQNQSVELMLDSGQQMPLTSVEQIAPTPVATSVATGAGTSGITVTRGAAAPAATPAAAAA